MAPKHRGLRGKDVIKILCNHFGFSISGQKGSHVRLSKLTPEGKVGTVVPMHDEIRVETLRSLLKLANVDPDAFERYT